MATRLVMILTSTERTTLGTLIEVVLLATIVGDGAITWVLHHRRKTGAEQAQSADEIPK